MNGHLGLIHGIIPATVGLRAAIPENHPSTRNLGTDRAGSGTIIDPRGYVLTVHYVVQGASSITVTLADGERFPGELAAMDFETGLALVKIPARGLPFLKSAPAGSVVIGEPAVIIASSGEAERRLSGGYVSSFESYDGHWEFMLDRTIRLTAINPGFGGGSLANFKGELIGVVSLNLGDIGKFSLAIPIDYYLLYEQELKQYGKVRSRHQRPWLGFYPQPLAGHIAVGGVFPGGPADRCGLKQGDIIIGVEKITIRSRPELYQEIWKKRPGDRITFRLLRDETSLELDVIGGDRGDFYRS